MSDVSLLLPNGFVLDLTALSTEGGAVGQIPVVTDIGGGVLRFQIGSVTGFIPISEKGAPGGVATLDGTGKLTIAQLPALAINEIFPVSSEAEMLALTAQRGDVAIRSDVSGTPPLADRWYMLAADDPTILANWKQITTGAGGGSSGGTRTKTTVTSAILGPGAQELGNFALAKASILVRAVAIFNRQCRIRLYGTSAARDADLARPIDESAVSGSGSTGTGIAADLVIGEDEGYAINCDPKPILANPGDPPVTTCYYTIDNLTSGTVAVSIELHHTPVEA